MSAVIFGSIQSAGAGWVRINFRLGACFADWVSVGCNGKTALEHRSAVGCDAGSLGDAGDFACPHDAARLHNLDANQVGDFSTHHLDRLGRAEHALVRHDGRIDGPGDGRQARRKVRTRDRVVRIVHQRQRDAPMGHAACRVGLDGLFKDFLGVEVPVRVLIAHRTIEPALGHLVAGRLEMNVAKLLVYVVLRDQGCRR